MSALPGRSPYPLAVPCTWRTPASTAAMVLATAQAVSFCACMPSRSGAIPVRATSPSITAVTWEGSMPPLVSQRTKRSAPAASAVSATAAV